MKYHNNILYVDIDNLDYRLMLTIDHPKRLKLFLGIIHLTDFEITTDTILHLPSEKESEIRKYIKSIFKS